MPAQSNNQNAILAKLKKQGADKSLKNHKGDEKELPKSGGTVPAGIDNGIAQLIVARFDEKKDGKHKGKPILNLQAIVVDVLDSDPKLKTAIKKRIFNSEDLFDTPEASKVKTFDQHFAVALNKLRLLGVDTEGIEAADDLIDLLAALEQEKPCFEFRSWQGQPWKGKPGRIQVPWGEKLEDYTPPDGTEGSVEDNSGEESTEDSSNDSAVEGESDSSPEEVDWDEMAIKAEANDQEAKDAFTAKAEELGIAKEVEEAENWEAAAELIKATLSGDAPSEPEEAPWVPEKNEVYKIKPKGESKKIDVKVTAVSTKNKTMDVVGVANKKNYKGLKWSNEDGKSIDGQSV